MVRIGILSTAKIGREQVIPALLDAVRAGKAAVARNRRARRILADQLQSQTFFERTNLPLGPLQLSFQLLDLLGVGTGRIGRRRVHDQLSIRIADVRPQ